MLVKLFRQSHAAAAIQYLFALWQVLAPCRPMSRNIAGPGY